MVETKHGVASSQLASKQHSISKFAKTAPSGQTDNTLEKCMQMFNTWLDYRKKLLPAWERDMKLYNNERYQPHYKGVADTFVPMTYSTIETISAALSTADYNTDFVPQDIYKYLKERLMPGFTGKVQDPNDPELMVKETEDQYLIRAIKEAMNGEAITDEALEVLNALYDYYWDVGDYEEHVSDLIDDGLNLGNGANWMVFKNSRPELISVPFPDYIFDPTATSDDTCKFAGRRYLASLKDLRAEVIPDTDNVDKDGNPKLKKRYNLKGLKKREDQDKTYKELMEQMLLGSTLEIKNDKGELKDDLDQCEVIELMTEERMYTIVNRSIVAEDVENPIVAQAKLMGIEDMSRIIKIPGVTWANNKRGQVFIGRSETSTFWQEQERLNDATNQKSDAVTRALLQNYRADPALKPQKNSFSVPGAVIWGSQGQYEAIPPAMVPNVAFSEENSIKNNIRETTATDQIVKGVGNAAGDVTATEAKLQVAQSGQRIEKKIRKLERGPLKRIARLALQYVRLFVTDPFIVPQKVNNGITPLLFDPKKYNFDFEPKVTLTIAAQDNRKQDQQSASESYQQIIQDPTNDLQAAKEIMYPKMYDLDKDEIQRITTNPNAGMMGGMGEEMPTEDMAMLGGQPGMMPQPEGAML